MRIRLKSLFIFTCQFVIFTLGFFTNSALASPLIITSTGGGSIGQPCQFVGRTIGHGAAATFFTTSAVPFGQACQSQQRVCNNGTLSGSAMFSTCTGAPGRSCAAGGRTIAHGAQATFFTSSGVGFGQTCQSENRTCNNGTLSGSAMFSTCTGAPGRSCTSLGRTIAHGAEVPFFTSSGLALGGGCICNNGTLFDKANGAKCYVYPPQDCFIAGTKVLHGSKITMYANAVVPSGTSCRSEERECLDGKLSGTAPFTSCVSEDAGYRNRTSFGPGQFILKTGERAEFQGHNLIMQPDCNLAQYNSNGVVQWSSGTTGRCQQGVASFGRDGRLTITDLANQKILFSTTSGVSAELRLSNQFPFATILSNETRNDGVLQRQLWAAAYKNVGVNTLPSLTPYVLPSVTINSAADFLIQDVCLNSTGLPTNADPASCTSRRNIRIGEPVPYIRTDGAGNQVNQWASNLPLLSGNELRIISKRDLGANSRTNQQSLFAFGDFNLIEGDAYDKIEASGPFFSAFGLRDANTLSLNHVWFNRQCQPGDGMLLFTSTLPAGTEGTGLSEYRGGLWGRCNPNQRFVQELTFWVYPTDPVTFTSGKQLNTIKSYRFGGRDPSRDLKYAEVFYFTREYGLSRWERWSTQGEANSTGACNGDVSTHFYGQRFWRHDCREWTTVRALGAPAQPYDVPLQAEFATSRNLLEGGDFASARLGKWKRTSGVIQWRFVDYNLERNISLEINCAGECKQNSIYQDVDLRPTLASYQQAGQGTRYNLQAGLLLATTTGASASVVVHRWGPNNQYYEPGGFEVKMPATSRTVPIHMTIPIDTAKEPLERVRLEFFPRSSARYTIDDAFLAVLPAQ